MLLCFIVLVLQRPRLLKAWEETSEAIQTDETCFCTGQSFLALSYSVEANSKCCKSKLP